MRCLAAERTEMTPRLAATTRKYRTSGSDLRITSTQVFSRRISRFRTQTGHVLALSTACRLTEGILRGPIAPDSALVNLHSLSECKREILVGVRRFELLVSAYPVQFSAWISSKLKLSIGEGGWGRRRVRCVLVQPQRLVSGINNVES